MTRRSLAAGIAILLAMLAAPGAALAQSVQPDLSSLMRSQILDIWLSRTPDGQRILIDPPTADLRTLSPFTIVTQIEQQIGSRAPARGDPQAAPRRPAPSVDLPLS